MVDLALSDITGIYEDNCVATCPDGYWETMDGPGNPVCTECHENCLTCTSQGGSGAFCTKCGKETRTNVITGETTEVQLYLETLYSS